MKYPTTRLRRNRQSSAIREMVQENRLHPSDFIAPIFIMEGKDEKEEIPSMPGYFRYSLDRLGEELEELIEVGIQSVLLFVKVPDSKRIIKAQKRSTTKG